LTGKTKEKLKHRYLSFIVPVPISCCLWLKNTYISEGRAFGDAHITQEHIEALIGEYLYTDRLPTGQDIVDRLPEAPRLMERQTVVSRIREAIKDIVDIFEW
jgi:type I restriction enzyme R subunit